MIIVGVVLFYYFVPIMKSPSLPSPEDDPSGSFPKWISLHEYRKMNNIVF